MPLWEYEMQTKESFPQTMYFGFSAESAIEHPRCCLSVFGIQKSTESRKQSDISNGVCCTGSKWFYEHSFPTRTTAAIELLNITKQVPESLTMAFIQPFSSLSTQANIYVPQNRVINTTSTISQCKSPHVHLRGPFRGSLGAHAMDNCKFLSVI